MQKPPLWQVTVVLALGVLAVSAAAILVRLSIEAAGVSGFGFSLFVAASRMMIAATILLPAWRNLGQTEVTWQGYFYAGAAGLALAAHFAAWITSLSFTSIAASITLVTTNPVWVALFSWLWYREKLTRWTIVGMAIALIGGVTITYGSNNGNAISSNPLLGNLLALIGAVMVSLYLLCGREAQRRGLRIGGYIAVAYTTAAIALLPLPLLFGSGYWGYPKIVYGYIFLMAVLSQLVGHTSFNWAVRSTSPTVVTLVILFEPAIALFWGFLVFGEIPSALVLLGAVVLLIGVVIAVIGRRKLLR